MMGFKELFKKNINKMGYNLEKLVPITDAFYLRCKVIDDLNIKDLIDIGANIGQYGEKILSKGYVGNLYSFEPIKETFDVLEKKAKANPQWKVFNYALSNVSGSQEMYVNEASMNSTFLDRKEEYIDSKNIDKVKVPLITFDEWVNKENLSLENYWFKIDTEGYEKFVLEGAKKNLQKAAIVELELTSLFEYEDMSYQSSISNMISYMKEHNFEVIHLDNIYRNKGKLFVSSMDVIFIRNDLKNQIKDIGLYKQSGFIKPTIG